MIMVEAPLKAGSRLVGGQKHYECMVFPRPESEKNDGVKAQLENSFAGNGKTVVEIKSGSTGATGPV